jgi:hypothetical protein
VGINRTGAAQLRELAEEKFLESNIKKVAMVPNDAEAARSNSVTSFSSISDP